MNVSAVSVQSDAGSLDLATDGSLAQIFTETLDEPPLHTIQLGSRTSTRTGRSPLNKVYVNHGKRMMDTVAACLIGLLSLPFALLAALLIRMDDGGVALFRQQRLGRGGNAFTILKLRSMPLGTANVESAHAAHIQITRVGRVLRRTSVDEIPQLWNIVRGDMSLVGPRPALVEQRSLAELRIASGALDVRPGLTGLAQVNGYNGMSEQEKAAWDADYAASVSFRRDLLILIKTVGYLLRTPPKY